MKFFIIACGCLLFSGCMTTTKTGTFGADRKQFMVIPEKAWKAQSERSYKRFVQKAKNSQVMVIDAKLDKVLNNMKSHAESFRTGSKAWNWEINASLNGELNAYGFPGGKVVINTGLYWGLGLNEDELAFVVAHEMAHALRDHNREKASLMVASNVAMLSASAGLGALATVATTVTSQTAYVPKAWTMESEADVLGLEIMANAGYNPEAALSFWKKYQQEEERRKKYNVSPQMGETLFTKRMENISKFLPVMQEKYLQAKNTGADSSVSLTTQNIVK